MIVSLNEHNHGQEVLDGMLVLLYMPVHGREYPFGKFSQASAMDKPLFHISDTV